MYMYTNKRLRAIKKASTLVKKGYIGYLKEDEDFPPYHINDIIAKSRGDAKQQAKIALGVDYIEVHVKRDRNMDQYVHYHEGVKIEGTLYRIEAEIDRIERKKKISALPDDGEYYIQDARNYVGNCMLFHELDLNGYTTNIDRAEIMSGAEVKARHWRPTDVIWEVSVIRNCIKRTVDMQNLNRTTGI